MTGSLKITGKLTAGSTLTASIGTLADANGIENISYIWKIGSTTLPTPNPSYTLTAADLKSDISVTPVYNNTTGKLVTDSPSLHIFNRAHTGTIAINGSVTVGNTLTVTNTLKDADGLGTLHYSWARDGVSFINDKPTYKVLTSDLGKSITATVSYNDNAKFHYLESESKTTVPVTVSTQTTAGNDVLTSTMALNTLTGGLGSDTFTFVNAITSGVTDDTRDVITDFNHSQGDKIDLSGIDADEGTVGNNSFVVVSSPSGSNATGQVWFDADTSILYGSTDADVDPEFSIQLTGVTVLETSDIIL